MISSQRTASAGTERADHRSVMSQRTSISAVVPAEMKQSRSALEVIP